MTAGRGRRDAGGIGILARTFPGSDPDTVLGAVSASGISSTQFNLSCAGLLTVPDVIGPHVSVTLRDSSQHHSVSIDALSGTCNMASSDATQRDESVRRLVRLAEFCRDTGIPVLTLSTGTRHPHDLWCGHPDNQSAAAHADLRHALRGLLRDTEHCGVTLAFEPEPANVIRTATEAATLLDDLRSPRLAVLFDAANLVQRLPVDRQRDVIEDACNTLAGRIALAHAKDIDAAGRVVAPGQGTIDFAHYVHTLRTVGRYHGPIIMHGLTPSDVPAALAHLRQSGG